MLALRQEICINAKFHGRRRGDLMTFRHGRLGGNCAVRPLLAAALYLLCLAMAVPAQAQPGPQLPVDATTNIVGDTVRQVVGDAAEVVTLMAPSADPHLYRATPNDLLRLSHADNIFYNGLNLEGRMADVLAQMSRRKPTFAVTEYMTPEELLPSAGFGGLYDPHVWFDVSLWIKAVERIRDAMIEVD